ncbi:MAG: L,D-transpeptidase family protein [Ilumatobacteraceae bacterium]
MRTVAIRNVAAVACAVGATVCVFPSAVSAQPGRTTVCQQVATNVGVRNPATTQVIVVLAAFDEPARATLEVATKTPKGWMCGAAMSARVGRAGVRPFVERRSGDGTTPAGVFAIGTMTAWDGQVFNFFGNAADPGITAGAYRRVQAGDCFGATPNHVDYGHLVQRTKANCQTPDEYLPSVESAYAHAALINANMEPNVSGDAPGEIPYASAIFLHRFSLDANGNPRATSGCVSLGLNNLVEVLRAMQPTTMFAIGEPKWLLANS